MDEMIVVIIIMVVAVGLILGLGIPLSTVEYTVSVDSTEVLDLINEMGSHSKVWYVTSYQVDSETIFVVNARMHGGEHDIQNLIKYKMNFNYNLIHESPN